LFETAYFFPFFSKSIPFPFGAFWPFQPLPFSSGAQLFFDWSVGTSFFEFVSAPQEDGAIRALAFFPHPVFFFAALSGSFSRLLWQWGLSKKNQTLLTTHLYSPGYLFFFFRGAISFWEQKIFPLFLQPPPFRPAPPLGSSFLGGVVFHFFRFRKVFFLLNPCTAGPLGAFLVRSSFQKTRPLKGMPFGFLFFIRGPFEIGAPRFFDFFFPGSGNFKWPPPRDFSISTNLWAGSHTFQDPSGTWCSHSQGTRSGITIPFSTLWEILSHRSANFSSVTCSIESGKPRTPLPLGGKLPFLTFSL